MGIKRKKGRKRKEESAAGLADLGLIFFVATHMVPCFRFVSKTVLTIHQSGTYC